MQTSKGGLLQLTIIKAELNRDTEFLGDMDPFMVVTYNGISQRTPALQDAGKTPEWNLNLEPFPVSSMADDITFKCFDENFRKDELIGEAKISVGRICGKEAKKRWLTLNFKGKDVGDLLI